MSGVQGWLRGRIEAGKDWRSVFYLSSVYVGSSNDYCDSSGDCLHTTYEAN